MTKDETKPIKLYKHYYECPHHGLTVSPETVKPANEYMWNIGGSSYIASVRYVGSEVREVNLIDGFEMEKGATR